MQIENINSSNFELYGYTFTFILESIEEYNIVFKFFEMIKNGYSFDIAKNYTNISGLTSGHLFISKHEELVIKIIRENKINKIIDLT